MASCPPGPTFSAVLAFPARVTDFLPSLPTGEVAKGIVSGAAEDGAALPIVVLVTHEAVGILEVRAAAAVQVLGPLLTHRQVPLCGQAADEPLRVFCGQRRLLWMRILSLEAGGMGTRPAARGGGQRPLLKLLGRQAE